MIRAWHFLRDDMRSGEGDEEPWHEGESRTITGRLKLCARGYHSSPTPWDALRYAPGSVLCLVEVSKPVGQDADKYVSHTRQLIKAINIEKELRLFACDEAEMALNLEVQRGNTVDERSRAAIEVVRRFANGQADSQELGAAYAAAYAAAHAAAYAAAHAAARAAAHAAAYAAAHQRFNARVEPLFTEVVVPS